MLCEAADMDLVDDQILHREQRIFVGPPVKIVADDPCFVKILIPRLFAPDALPGDRFGIGVEQDPAFVKCKSLLRVVRTVDAVGVFKLFNIKIEDDHCVDVADAVGFRKFECCKWHIRLPSEQQQLHARRSVRMDREVHGSGERSGPVQLVETGTDAEAADFVHGDHLNIFEGTGEEFVLFHSASSFQMNLRHHAVRKLLWTW